MPLKITLEAILSNIGCKDIEYSDFKFLQEQSLIAHLNFKIDNYPVEIIMYFKGDSLGINFSLNNASKRDVDIITRQMKNHKELLINDFRQSIKF
nr:hypothetical protein [uncultured Flavobacterium sp.]